MPEVEPLKHVKKIQCPVFFIHGDEDTKIPAHHSKQLYESAVGDKELWIAEGVGHLGTFLKYRHEYETRVLDFFRRTLLERE